VQADKEALRAFNLKVHEAKNARDGNFLASALESELAFTRLDGITVDNADRAATGSPLTCRIRSRPTARAISCAAADICRRHDGSRIRFEASSLWTYTGANFSCEKQLESA
jgi:hypothetical protein